jgi:hypothetical protein
MARGLFRLWTSRTILWGALWIWIIQFGWQGMQFDQLKRRDFIARRSWRLCAGASAPRRSARRMAYCTESNG